MLVPTVPVSTAANPIANNHAIARLIEPVVPRLPIRRKVRVAKDAGLHPPTGLYSPRS